MLDISGEIKCFYCDNPINWKIFHKEAVPPYESKNGAMTTYHSGHSEIKRESFVSNYAFFDKNTFYIDTKCYNCEMISRIIYKIDEV